MSRVKNHKEKVLAAMHLVASSSSGVDLQHDNKVSNTLRKPNYKTHSCKIDLEAFNEILEIDKENNTVWVEPRVTMKQLCEATLNEGFIPYVVPEFSSITVGGAIMGAALESSSFKYGQFNDICESYELLLGDGSVVGVSKIHHSDLFYGISGSYGSIAGLLSAKVALRKALPYVHLVCHRYHSLEEALKALLQGCHSPADFVDAVVLNQSTIIVMTGRMTHEYPKEATYVSFSKPWSPWFIQHLLSIQSSRSFCFTLKNYLFRYDKGAFWMGQYFTNLQAAYIIFSQRHKQSSNLSETLRNLFHKYPPNLNPGWLFQTLLGWKLYSPYLYKVLHSFPEETFAHLFFVHDFYLTLDKVKTFLEYVQKYIGIYPLWLCPIKSTTTPQFLSPHVLPEASPVLINVGIYGTPQTSDIPMLTKETEKIVHALGGRKILYSLNYYSKEDFWKIYHKEKYDKIRSIVKAEGVFTDVYEKIKN